MDTYFAPPERAHDDELATEIDIVSKNPVMSGLLYSISGLLAVLDEHREIPQEIANRIFQRNFSTEEQAGRGLGTFSMKLFGEEILGGQVSFQSSKKEGTTFKFTYPI